MRPVLNETEEQKQRALRRLGNDNPRCAVCDEQEWRCLELQHVGDRRFDPNTAGSLRRNRHRTQSAPRNNQRAPDAPTSPITA